MATGCLYHEGPGTFEEKHLVSTYPNLRFLLWIELKIQWKISTAT
jgi:hypothetical protein